MRTWTLTAEQTAVYEESTPAGDSARREIRCHAATVAREDAAERRAEYGRCEVCADEGYLLDVFDVEVQVVSVSVRDEAVQIVGDAGAAGGIDEVRRLAERGWPENRALVPDDSPELRAAIQEHAREVVAEVDS